MVKVQPRHLPRSSLLDSNMRFFGGLWMGFGIAMLWLVPSIERQGVLFRALCHSPPSPLSRSWVRLYSSIGSKVQELASARLETLLATPAVAAAQG